jgi:hypothetical protein
MESAPPLTAEILMRHEACVLRLARTLVRSAAVAEIAKSSLGWPTAIGAGLALEAIAVSPEQCTLAWRILDSRPVADPDRVRVPKLGPRDLPAPPAELEFMTEAELRAALVNLGARADQVLFDRFTAEVEARLRSRRRGNRRCARRATGTSRPSANSGSGATRWAVRKARAQSSAALTGSARRTPCARRPRRRPAVVHVAAEDEQGVVIAWKLLKSWPVNEPQ